MHVRLNGEYSPSLSLFLSLSYEVRLTARITAALCAYAMLLLSIYKVTAARFIAAFENDLDIDYTRPPFPNPLAPCDSGMAFHARLVAAARHAN